MDQADMTQIRSDQEERQMLANRTKPKGESSVFCKECAGLIPAKRREFVPGVQTCLPCQQVIEMGGFE